MKKRITAGIITGVLLMCTVLMAGCGQNDAAGNDGKKIEGDLKDVMAQR